MAIATGEVALAADVNAAIIDRSKFIWLDTSIRLVDDANRTTSLGMTDVDITGSTSVNAKWAILCIIGYTDSVSGGSALCKVRKNGTNPTYMTGIDYSNAAGQFIQSTVMVGLDSGNIFEYKIDITGTIQVDTYIDLLGYAE